MSNLEKGSQERKIKLKALLDRGDEIRSSLAQQDVKESLQQIREVVSECNNIIMEGNIQDRREHTTEVVMDAQVVKMNHELVSKVFERSSEFNDQIYINGLENVLKNDEEELDWDILTNFVTKIVSTCRVKSTMFGAIETVCKEKTVRQRANRQVLENEERPELVVNLERRDKGAEKINDVHKQVAMLFQINNIVTIPWYLLIIDPHNFMNTVENAFQLAFLVRDNIIGLRIGSDGHPEAWLIKSDEPRPTDGTKQNALTLNTKICQRMIELYNITEPLLCLT